MEEALLARLRANVALAALVGDRVDWMERPQGDALPSVTLQVINQARTYTLDGPSGFYGPIVQVDCWGADYGSAKLVSRAVLDAIEGEATQGLIAFSRAFQVGSRDLGPEDIGGGAKVYRVSQDYSVWWKPAA